METTDFQKVGIASRVLTRVTVPKECYESRTELACTRPRLPQSVLSWGVPNPLSHAARSKFISRGPVHSALIAMEMDKSSWPCVFGGIDGGYKICTSVV